MDGIRWRVVLRRAKEAALIIKYFGPMRGVPILVQFFILLNGVKGRECTLQLTKDINIKLRAKTSDRDVFSQIFLGREYSLDRLPHYGMIAAHYRALLVAGKKPVIVDCGANIGASAIFFNQAFPEATIVAIEPNQETAQVAKFNTKNCPAISVLAAAISDRPGMLCLENPEEPAWASRFVERGVGSMGKSVEALTIWDILERTETDEVFLLKVDIEGGERELFRSNIEWLDRVGVMVIEIHDWLFPGQSTSSTLFRALGSRDIEVVIRGETLVLMNMNRLRRPTCGERP